MVLAVTPVISEFLASNSGGLLDSDGESSDWIEIYNPASTPFDLTGWALTDDPGDLNQWVLPAVTVPANDFLVVFASSKDRAVAGQELHTNFRLTGAGEFLALVEPSGVIASEYAPTYPQQSSNVSYGMNFSVDEFVTAGSPARTFVPTNGTLGTTWASPTFNDAAWSPGQTGVGYGIANPGFDVRYVRARSATGFDGAVTSLAIAETVLATPAYQLLSINSSAQVINYLGTGSGANFPQDFAFPNQSIGDDINNFIIEATATIVIPASGNWSFGVNSDDGFGLQLTRGANTYTSQFPGTRGTRDTIQTFNLAEAGTYQVRLVMFEAQGGASVEFFAAQGAISTFNNSFRLVGDDAAGGIDAFRPYVAGASDVVNHDIRTSLQGVNAGAYVRIPFQANNVNQIDSLTLKMRYDDGFVAYINGIEVARRNAPMSVSFNSLATASRSLDQSRSVESIILDATALAALVNGTNVLSIHGLNDSISDDTFLVLPELTGTSLLSDQISYFATPTPGAANSDSVLGIVEPVNASVAAGFYSAPFSVSLTTATPGATIRFTTDGSTPTATHGTIYSGPVSISGTTNLRAVSYLTNYVTLPTITRTYLFLDDVLNQSNDGTAPAGWPSTWNTNVVDYGIDPDIRLSETDQKIKDALLSLPTWSITTDLENLFDPLIGIYSNASEDGRDWERLAAVELLNPDGSTGFQVNAGLRIRGGFSRSDNNPKHALKLFFRGEYGNPTLNYPVHGPDGVSVFDKIDLRTPNNYSWSFSGDASNNFVAEVIARYNQRDLDQPYTRSTWIHLYLNGQYWGMYQTQERAEANYAAAYLGGEAFNYDVIKPERGDYRNIATDGNFDAYTRLWQQANARAADGRTPAFVSNAEYLRAQGKNPDGTNNPNFEVLLDVDNLITYMLETLRGGNLDAPISNFLGNDQPNNYFAIRDRTGREGFRFFQHDAEHTMRNVNQDRNGPWNSSNFEIGVDYFNPQWLHQQLMANDEYRLRFADEVQSAFFNGGPLSNTALAAKIASEVAKIDLATVAESARWGDSKRAVPLTQNDFRNAISNLLNNYVPARNSIVLNQFRNTSLALKDAGGAYSVIVPAPLFPSTDAPQFLINGVPQDGGNVESNSQLRFNSPGGTVYYTTDGTDPRLFGGNINPSASTYTTQSSSTLAFTTGSSWRYLDNGTTPANWTLPNYNDAAWSSGNAEFGFGDGGEATIVSFGPNASNKHITTYFRRNFNVNAASGTVTGATLRIRRDDGAVIYINGVEAARSNMPSGAITPTTFASSSVNDASEDTYFELPLSAAFFTSGTNTIAVEIHQVNLTSSDLSFDADLTVHQQLVNAIPLTFPTQFNARARSASGVWSALEQADFLVNLVPASSTNLRVTEIHYNPIGTGSTEFIELRNVSQETVSLEGVRFDLGITYDFNASSIQWLGAGEVLVLAENVAEFNTLYGENSRLGGQYSGALSNGGEAISLRAADGSVIQAFTYDDNGPQWHPSTDGGGPSLTVLRTSGNYNVGTNYRPSFVNGGTPGFEENDTPTDIVASSTSVAENRPFELIAILSAVDSDDFETATFSLLPVGDQSRFVVTGNELRVGNVGLDYESQGLHSITIRVIDASGASFDKSFTISVTDALDTPAISATPLVKVYDRQAFAFAATADDGPGGLPADSNPANFVYRYYAGPGLSGGQIAAPKNVGNYSVDVSYVGNASYTAIASVGFDFTISAKAITGSITAENKVFDGNTSATILTRSLVGVEPGDTVTYSGGTAIFDNAAVGNGKMVTATGLGLVGADAANYTVNATAITTANITQPVATVSNRRVFYNSASGANLSSAGPANNAIASDKTALLPGGSSTFANYTNYSRGLNGVIIDINNLPETTTDSQILASLQFARWNGIDAGGFAPLPVTAVPAATILAGSGTGGSARVKISFPDNALQNTWLRVTVVANAQTSLAANDVFYFGNVIGELGIGNTGTRLRVNATDTGAVRSNQSTAANSALVSNIYDVNRDGRVNATDTGIVRSNQQTAGIVAPIVTPTNVATAFSIPLVNVNEVAFTVAPINSSSGASPQNSTRRDQQAKSNTDWNVSPAKPTSTELIVRFKSWLTGTLVQSVTVKTPDEVVVKLEELDLYFASLNNTPSIL